MSLTEKLRQSMVERGMRLLSDPRVTQLASDPRLASLVLAGFRWKGRAEEELDRAVRALARRLHLATEEEVTELRQTIQLLEQELEASRRARRNSDGR